jgi:hypothetical protein
LDIIVKYCGGCNCQIDRSNLIREIETALPSDDHLVSAGASKPAGAGILLCGCPSACAWKPELADLANRWIVAAGKTVDLSETAEEQMAEVILRKINEIKR